MGGILCVTPANKVQPQQPVERKKCTPSRQEIANLSKVDVQTYNKAKGYGLRRTVLQDIEHFIPDIDADQLSPADAFWMYAKCSGMKIAGWNGYMEGITASLPFHISRIIYLPFIDMPPTDYDIIYLQV